MSKPNREANILAHRRAWTERQENKREIRESNLAERAKRSPKQQLAVLDRRLGKGIGAKRERAKLAKELETK